MTDRQRRYRQAITIAVAIGLLGMTLSAGAAMAQEQTDGVDADNTSVEQASDSVAENVTVEESEQAVVDDQQTVEVEETVTDTGDTDSADLFDLEDGFFDDGFTDDGFGDDFLTGSLFE
ncbi:hypothetical protein G6M89_08840 [Natronolimnobius sp. AArcel1]|uniref:hypothetical protein n=1 Tax=Natronolimnobius sp. AArcel1 TaxID=1679093 RepID=UPI0013ED38AA|nr:hypothetical protein [Natronolimnobius sp. AArcel1]NGM69111.1 hypothetical protein [Natronolimnobius sp. AArcel1]